MLFQYDWKKKVVVSLRPLRMPFTFFGQSCCARLPGAVNGSNKVDCKTAPTSIAVKNTQLELKYFPDPSVLETSQHVVPYCMCYASQQNISDM